MPLDYKHTYIILISLEVLKVKIIAKAICLEAPHPQFSPPFMSEQPLEVFSQPQPKQEPYTEMSWL